MCKIHCWVGHVPPPPPPPPGLCPHTMFDTKYTWQNERVNNFYRFNGYLHTVMLFDPDLGGWRLQIYGKDDTVATVNATDYPFGTLQWEVRNDYR